MAKTKDRWIKIGLIMVVAWSVGLNLWAMKSESIRLDEAQSLWFVNGSVWGLLKITAQDVHVPLYGLTLHYWLKLWGNEILTARMLSFIYFLLNMPLIYLLGKEAGGKKIGYMATAIFCLSPFIGWYSAETRMYTLFSLVTTINQLFFLKMIRSNMERNKFGYWLSAVFGFYTHYFFVFLVATQGLYAIFRLAKQEVRMKNKWWSWRQVTFVGLATAAFAIFIPWLWYMYQNGMGAEMSPLLAQPSAYNLVSVFVSYLFGFQTYSIQGVLVSMWPLLALVIFLIYTRRIKRKIENLDYLGLVTIAPVLMVFGLSFVRPIFLPRYLIIVTPTLFVILAWILVSHSRRISQILSIGMIIALMGLGLKQRVSGATPVKENYKEATNYLEENVTSGDIIALSAPFTIYPVEYEYLGEARLDTIPSWSRFDDKPIPDFRYDTVSVQIQNYQKQYDKLYVMLSYDQGYEKQLKDYLDSQLQLIEVKNFPADIELRVYDLAGKIVRR